jgi:hypothetical protein
MEPAAIVGFIGTVLALLVAFGINVSTEQQETIKNFAMAIIPIVGALVIRSQVIPVAKVEAAHGAEGVSKAESIRGSMLMVLLAIGLAGSAACASKTTPSTSPEAQVAIYGDRFLAAVEFASEQTIKLGDAQPELRPRLTPVLGVYIEIGKAGQDLGKALRGLDAAGSEDDRVKYASLARVILLDFNHRLQQIGINLDPAIRERVAMIIQNAELVARLLDAWQVIAKWLPAPAVKPAALVRSCITDANGWCSGPIDLHVVTFHAEQTCAQIGGRMLEVNCGR